MKTVALVTGGLRIGDDAHAQMLGYDHSMELYEALRQSLIQHQKFASADVYLMGGLFAIDAYQGGEEPERLLKKLPGRKIMVSDDWLGREGLLDGWHECLPRHTVSPWGQPILLTCTPEETSGLNIHGTLTEADTPTSVTCVWEKWGGAFGAVNLYYLQTYAASIAAGFIEGN